MGSHGDCVDGCDHSRHCSYLHGEKDWFTLGGHGFGPLSKSRIGPRRFPQIFSNDAREEIFRRRAAFSVEPTGRGC